MNVRFSNRPVWVKRFQTIHQYSVDVARGLVLLSGIGSWALPSWGSRTGWTNLLGGLAVGLTVGPADIAISPHPSSREGHHATAWWSSRFSYRVYIQLSRCNGVFAPAELGAINPDAVHDDGQPTRQRHDRLFHTAAPGDLYRPGLEPGPFR